MAVSIVATHIRADHRKPGLPGWGAVDFEWSDPPDANGVKRMERCPMHGVPAGVDLVTYAAQFIPDREAGRVRRHGCSNRRQGDGRAAKYHFPTRYGSARYGGHYTC